MLVYNPSEDTFVLPESPDVGAAYTLDWLDIAPITTLQGLLCNYDSQSCIIAWDTSRVTNMKDLFRFSQYNLPLIHVSTGEMWETCNVKHTDRMFMFSKWNHPLWHAGTGKAWSLKNVTTASFMFNSASFTGLLPGKKWKFQKLKTSYGAFRFNRVFTQWCSVPKKLITMDSEWEGPRIDHLEFNINYCDACFPRALNPWKINAKWCADCCEKLKQINHDSRLKYH